MERGKNQNIAVGNVFLIGFPFTNLIADIIINASDMKRAIR